MKDSGNSPGRGRWIPAAALGALLLLPPLTGCENEGNQVPEGSVYPPPAEGNTAVVDLSHQLVGIGGGDDDISQVVVQVLTQGTGTVNAEVFVNREQVNYNANTGAFSGRITPPLNPGSLVPLRVRSASWGEDSTFVRLAGDFTLEVESPHDPALPGDTVRISWSQAAFADEYELRVEGVGSPDPLLFIKLDATRYDWLVPDTASGEAKVTVQALVNLSEGGTWQGGSRVQRASILSLGDGAPAGAE